MLSMTDPDGSMLHDVVGDLLRNRFCTLQRTHENTWGPQKLLMAQTVNIVRTVTSMCHMHQSDEVHGYANDVWGNIKQSYPTRLTT